MKLVLNDNKTPIELKRNTDFFSIEFPAADLIKIVDGKYGYINFDRITSNRDIRKTFKILKGTEGVIVDIRNGTGNYKIDYFSRFISPENKPYIKWNIPNPNCIGSFYNIVEKTSKKSSGKKYKGKVVLLIDENVQSDTETACMLFQTCQQVTLIGTPTAGANGYMALIQLPGGIRTGFSVMGVYYPNGKTNQRTGIQPDIYAANTVEYVREGRDMIIERAIEFLKTGK
jgi:C-terminal processing protease CtpA/Prc